MASNTVKILWRWLLKPIVVLLLLLCCCELLLQLGAWVVRDQSRFTPEQWLTKNTRILALGDSNTYGLYLQEKEAWPAQLERLWNSQHPTKPIEVLNLGYPATNSLRVREYLPDLLEKLSPDIVLIMIGFNDFWTPVEKLDESTNHFVGWIAWVREHSRLYRLYRIAMRSYVSQQDIVAGYPRNGFVDKNSAAQKTINIGDEAFVMGAPVGAPAGNRKTLPDNISAMINTAKKHHAKVFLMTYPSNWGFYPGANKWIKIVAEQQHVPLIDITPIFIARCVSGAASCPDVLYHDGHATAKGNALVAAAVEGALIKNN